MDIFSKFFYSLYSPSSLFKKIKKEPLNDAAFYLLSMLVVVSVIFPATKIDEVMSFFRFSVVEGIFLNNLLFMVFSILSFLLILALSSFLLSYFFRIYYDNVDKESVFKSIVYALTPIFVLTLVSMVFQRGYEFIFLEKPMILLFFLVYSVIILQKGITTYTDIKGGFAWSAIVLFGLFIYILWLAKIDVILFYAFMMGLLFYKRKKFTPQGIVLLNRTKMGLNLMDRIAKKHPKILNFLGNMGIGAGFILMIGISYLLIRNAFDLLLKPETIPGATPILPGIPIPGSPITLPLWYGIISIFLVVLIHEFSHGVIARLHKIKVKASGPLFMGPIIGAFVEPDEKQMAKKSDRKQLSVLAAGPFSNVLLALVALLIINLAIAPLIGAITTTDGASINVLEGTPAESAELQSGMIITEIDNMQVNDANDLYLFLNSTSPKQDVMITTKNQSFLAVLTEHPENIDKGYLGITASTHTITKPEIVEKYGVFLPEVAYILQTFLFWLFLISFGIGVANLIPLGPVDGGRMLQVLLLRFYPKDKALKIWSKVAVGFIILLAFVIFFPLFKWISGQLVF